MKRILIDGTFMTENGKTVLTSEQAMKWYAWYQIVEAMEKQDQDSLDRSVEETERNCPDWEMRVLKRFLELTEADLVI